MAEKVDRSFRLESYESSNQVDENNSVEIALGNLQDCERKELLSELVGFEH